MIPPALVTHILVFPQQRSGLVVEMLPHPQAGGPTAPGRQHRWSM